MAGTISNQNYQNELAKKRASNPDGYFSQVQDGKEILYDKGLYGQNEKGHLTFHENTHTRRDGKIVKKELNVPKPRTEIVKNDKPVVKEKPATTPAPKGGGSIDLNKYKGGGLQVQNFGKNPENITIGHGPSTAKGDLSLQKGNNDMVNNSYSNNIGSANDLKISSTKPGGGATNSSSLIPKGGFGGGKLSVSGRPDFSKTNQMLDNSVKSKSSSPKPAGKKPASTSIEPMKGLVSLGADKMVSEMRDNVSKTEQTVKNAMDPSHKLVESGRVGRVRRRQEKRTANVKKRQEIKRGETPSNRDKIKTIRETNRQERKDLKQDMPVDKDATGGRFKTDKATKKLVKKSNKDSKALNKAKAKEKSANSKPSSGYSASQKSFQNDMKNTFETTKQETDNLKKDNPVDKDATGGRADSKPFDYSQNSKALKKKYKNKNK
jgi:hypothetical protein